MMKDFKKNEKERHYKVDNWVLGSLEKRLQPLSVV